MHHYMQVVELREAEVAKGIREAGEFKAVKTC
jgi:hypothetical protein